MVLYIRHININCLFCVLSFWILYLLLDEQRVIITASDEDAKEDSALLAEQRVIITASDEDAEEDSTLLAEQRLLLQRVMEMQKLIGPTNSHWYRKTLEGLKFFTCYLEPSVCWNIFC